MNIFKIYCTKLVSDFSINLMGTIKRVYFFIENRISFYGSSKRKGMYDFERENC